MVEKYQVRQQDVFSGTALRSWENIIVLHQPVYEFEKGNALRCKSFFEKCNAFYSSFKDEM